MQVHANDCIFICGTVQDRYLAHHAICLQVIKNIFESTDFLQWKNVHTSYDFFSSDFAHKQISKTECKRNTVICHQHQVSFERLFVCLHCWMYVCEEAIIKRHADDKERGREC